MISVEVEKDMYHYSSHVIVVSFSEQIIPKNKTVLLFVQTY